MYPVEHAKQLQKCKHYQKFTTTATVIDIHNSPFIQQAFSIFSTITFKIYAHKMFSIKISPNINVNIFIQQISTTAKQAQIPYFFP